MILLRAENKSLKSYINKIKKQDIYLTQNSDLDAEAELQEEVLMNKNFENLLKSISSVNNNIMNYCYSYSKREIKNLKLKQISIIIYL